MSLTSVDLPEPDTPVTQTNAPVGTVTSRFFRLCSRAPRTVKWPRPGLRAAGMAMLRLPDRNCPVTDRGSARMSSSTPLITTSPPCSPAPGPMSTMWSARPHGLLVVLHDDHRVAEVAQPQQGLDEPAVVALVQSDGRLVQDVEHAHQAGADLSGQTDALRLSARERAGVAMQAEIADAHRLEEAQPLPDLLEHPGADQLLALAQLQVVEEPDQLDHRQQARSRRC